MADNSVRGRTRRLELKAFETVAKRGGESRSSCTCHPIAKRNATREAQCLKIDPTLAFSPIEMLETDKKV